MGGYARGGPVYPCRGQRWGRYWCMWGLNELELVDTEAVGCTRDTADDIFFMLV